MAATAAMAASATSSHDGTAVVFAGAADATTATLEATGGEAAAVASTAVPATSSMSAKASNRRPLPRLQYPVQAAEQYKTAMKDAPVTCAGMELNIELIMANSERQAAAVDDISQQAMDLELKLVVQRVKYDRTQKRKSIEDERN